MTANPLASGFAVGEFGIAAAAPTPEPMALAAFGLMGLAGGGYVRRRVKGVAKA